MPKRSLPSGPYMTRLTRCEKESKEYQNKVHYYLLQMEKKSSREEKQNNHYMLDEYLVRPEPKMFSRGNSMGRKAIRPDRIKGNNFHQTYREYFPDSESNGNAGNSLFNRDHSESKEKNKDFNSPKYNCDYTLNSSQKSTRMSLEKQISFLTSKLKQKQKQIITKDINRVDKIKDNQMLELYRLVSFYEGKIKKMEEEIRKYEKTLHEIAKKCDEKSQHKTEVEKLVGLFEDMRNDNEDMNGKIEQKDFQIQNLNMVIKKNKSKKEFVTKKSSLLKNKTDRSNNESLSREKSAISQRTFQSATNLSMKKDMYGNMQSKINRIEISLNFLKKENDRLFEQLEEKSQIIQSLQIEIEDLEQRLEKEKVRDKEQSKINIRRQKEDKRQSSSTIKRPYSKSHPLNQVALIPQRMLKKVDKPEREQIPVSEKTTPAKKVEDKFPQLSSLTKQIRYEIIRKLKYQLMTEQVSYESLLEILLSEEKQAQIFQEFPYNLNSQESEWLCSWLDRAEQKSNEKEEFKKYLTIVLPSFPNITLKTENNLKIQLYNCFLNRERELSSFVSQLKNKIVSFEEIYAYFRAWPLTERHLDVLGKSIYEETGDAQRADFQHVEGILKKWGQ